MVKMRCKVHLAHKQKEGGGTHLHFGMVYTGSAENKSFFQATPGGIISFYTVNAEMASKFQVGAEYYVDFTAAVE